MTLETDNALPRILIVDDSRIVRAGVRKHLSTGFDIVEEHDGEAGWERLCNDPDILVVMTDLGMPKLDGFGLMQRIRRSADARVKHTPIIVISGEEEPETKQRAVNMGADDFVSKSTDRAEMVARVTAAVKRARTVRELRQTESEQAKVATTDPQTGVATSHMLRIEGEKALAHAARYHGKTTLVVFELDEFDVLAAEMGDKVADQLIGLVAKLVAGRLRKEETLARLDGPRFGVMLYADVEGSVVYVERLRETIAAARVNFKGRQLKVTASVGVAGADVDGDSFEGLLAVAVGRLEAARRHAVPQLATPEVVPMPTIEQALSLLARGEEDAVRAHLPQIMALLRPLLDLAGRVGAVES